MSGPDSVPPRATGRWRRPLFLAVSAAVVAVVIALAHSILLPFLMALVIAYVFTPSVAWLERRRLPRAVSILLVYAVLLGSIAVFVRAVAPRMAFELNSLRTELPALAKQAKETWIPAVTEKLRAVGIGAAPSEPEPREPEAKPGIVVRPGPEGTLEVDVGRGLAVNKAGEGWIIEPVKSRREERFDPQRIVSEVVGRSFTYAQANAVEIAKLGRDIVAGVSKGIFLFFITLMLAAYIMMTREKIFDFVESLIRPSGRAGFRRLLVRVDRGLSGVIRGQLLICLVNGILSAIGFAIVGLKYWPVLALVAAALSIIPIFGSIISTIPAVAIGLTQGIGTAVFVLLWIIGIHQIEANFLNPKIMGDAAKIHPVLVVFALLLGEHLFGGWGALLAVPVMSIGKSLFLHFRDLAHATDPELAPEVASRSSMAPPSGP